MAENEIQRQRNEHLADTSGAKKDDDADADKQPAPQKSGGEQKPSGDADADKQPAPQKSGGEQKPSGDAGGGTTH